MYLSRRPYTFDRVTRIIFSIAILVGTFYLINLLKGALLPFLVAWLLAYLMHPIVEFFHNKCRIKNRVVAISATLLSVVLFFGLLGWIFIPSIIEEMDKMKILIHNYISTDNTIPFLPESWHDYIREKIDFEQIAQMMNKEDWKKLIETTVTQAWSFLTGSVNQIITIVSWFIVLLYLFFILLDYEKIIVGFRGLIPRRYRRTVLGILTDVQVSMNRYFRGQSLVAFLVGILFSIGFLIVGLPLAIVLGLFIGLLNMVPYLQIIGFLPTVLLAILKAADTGENFWIIIACALAVFAIVQIIQDTFLVPKIMGKITGLNPAIILLSLSIWGSLMGMLGMIIALPLTTLMLSYYQRFIINKERIKYDEVETTDNQETSHNEEK